MRRTLRFFLCQCLVAGLALPPAAAAQETRGKISGTVRDSGGVIPGAAVKITNTDTSVSQTLTTNESGYFEASFLNPGTYAVGVQMPGFKAAVRDRIVLGVGEQLTVPFTLEVGQVTEEVVGHGGVAAARHDVAEIGRPGSTPTWSRACRCSRTCRSRWRGSRRAPT